MVVQAGLTPELWEWLQDRGFREITHRPDRRRYREMPPALVAALCAAVLAERTPLLKRAVEEAARRPLVNAGTPVQHTDP